MLNRASILSILSATLPLTGQRFDANETLAFSRQLEHIFAQALEVEYPEGAGRQLIPVDTSVHPGAESHTYRMFDDVGQADLIESYADDLPLVDAYGTEHTGKVVALGNAFIVSLQDMKRAQMLGMDIDARKAIGARKMMERKLDEMLATGNSKVSMTGLANHAIPAADLVTPVTGSWLDPTTTAAQIQADVEKLCKKIFVDTKGIHGSPDNGSKLTLVVGVAQYARLISTRLDSFNMMTLYEYLLAKLPMIAEIKPWGRLDLADAEGDGPRVVAFHKDPDVIRAVIPQDFEILPPQYRNLAYLVNCHMRYGGIIVARPKAIAYMDDCGA